MFGLAVERAGDGHRAANGAQDGGQDILAGNGQPVVRAAEGTVNSAVSADVATVAADFAHFNSAGGSAAKSPLPEPCWCRSGYHGGRILQMASLTLLLNVAGYGQPDANGLHS